jgi:hypothetical protein
MVGGLQIKIQCLRCSGIAAHETGSEQLTVAKHPNEQDPVAERKINCHRTQVVEFWNGWGFAPRLSRLTEFGPV